MQCEICGAPTADHRHSQPVLDAWHLWVDLIEEMRVTGDTKLTFPELQAGAEFMRALNSEEV